MSEPKLSDKMREYLFRLSEVQPVTQPEAGWPDAVAALEAKLERIEQLREIVNEQAEDEGLWFMAGTAPEQYLQDALRKLHATIEADEDMLAVLAQADLASLPTQQKPTEEGMEEA